MPARQNPLITAESLFHDLSTQLERYLRFLEIDLTPVILQSKLNCEDPSAVDLISHGVSSRLWIIRLQSIFEWTNLTSQEEAWLQSQGLELALPGSHVRGVWSMPTFLRNEGRSKDHNASSDLRQGRKIRRFEKELGAGIALLLAIVLPSFRRLPLGEEAKTIQLLRTNYADIIQSLLALRLRYQAVYMHWWAISALLCFS
jgi:hypothetical protein